METQKKINKKTQTITRLERQLIIEKIKERKQQTKRKIELGGLVIKAGMDGFPKDIILGALISVRKEIEKDSNAKSLYQSIGHSSFMELV
ncbi:MAG TPA: conjugal transfer protein TraD [Candidatus Aquirickettsiella sp.]|jgi:DNA polymerase I-like protein with 3'-5' exonuclease and polymerase domains